MANRINPQGMPAVALPVRKPRAPKQPKLKKIARSTADSFRLGMTLALGMGIPLLSLAMSKLAGTLAQAGMYLLAGFAFILMLAVLGVSLAHVAWAVEHITRSDRRSSWALAIALDLSLVLTELCHVYAEYLGLGFVCYTVMGSVAVVSMASNVYAFLFHGR